ncbi:MAG TPA: 4-hydroxy-3-methylbut-2-enyl diphosphate reductase [Bacteroidales bacterium]|jgi:4-hydroxy-3-methylbut-2-enyl diphosphate reductase|nr:4-hydroxy-3-methylbut-2-enyl diphosphate reductase [Bacteroidales bacterium]
MARIEIDKHSGYCFGVVKAIAKAEEHLDSKEELYCLGDIVHNNMEVKRLEKKGMKTVHYEEFAGLKNKKILIRAHGEPPSTYKTAERQGLELVDATCPVVLNLQKRVSKAYQEHKNDGTQILIFGKPGHAEVNGLVGQTQNTAIVVEHLADLVKVDLDRPVIMFSQTTKSLEEYRQLVEAITNEINPAVGFQHFDTICRHMSGRVLQVRDFAAANDLVFFVSDAKSSNGKSLYKACKEVNDNTHFISSPGEVRTIDVAGFQRIGISGATSTPRWLMEEVRREIEKKLQVSGESTQEL